MVLAQNESSSIFVWSLVLVVLVIGGSLAVSWVRKKVKEPDAAPAAGFTLADLREMHKKGQISAEEFERAKAKMSASLKAAMARQEKPKPR